jgi:hypothetical protein
MTSAARLMGSASRWLYRAVVAGCECPNSFPMMGSPREAPAPTDANEWRRSVVSRFEFQLPISLRIFATPASLCLAVKATGWGWKSERQRGIAAGSSNGRPRDSRTNASGLRQVPIVGREPMPMTADYAEAVRKHRFDLLYVEGKLAALIETIPKPITCLSRTWPFHRPFQGVALAGS